MSRVAAFRYLQQGLSVPRLPCENRTARLAIWSGRLRRRIGYRRASGADLMRRGRGGGSSKSAKLGHHAQVNGTLGGDQRPHVEGRSHSRSTAPDGSAAPHGPCCRLTRISGGNGPLAPSITHQSSCRTPNRSATSGSRPYPLSPCRPSPVRPDSSHPFGGFGFSLSRPSRRRRSLLLYRFYDFNASH